MQQLEGFRGWAQEGRKPLWMVDRSDVIMARVTCAIAKCEMQIKEGENGHLYSNHKVDGELWLPVKRPAGGQCRASPLANA
jgi:hypothetical protein